MSWWARQGSNLLPPACEAGALPVSYAPRAQFTAFIGPLDLLSSVKPLIILA
jgi:hypothetical protein